MATFDTTSSIKSKVIKGVLILGGLVILLPIVNPTAIVPAGTRGVMTTFGKISLEAYSEGIHLRIPLVQTMNLIDVRIQKGEGAGEAASKDLQSIRTSVAVNYHIRPEATVGVFRDFGKEIEYRLVLPAVQEAVKAATAQYTAEELITRRPEVRDKIRTYLNERIGRFGVVVDEFSITDFKFSKAFDDAVEAKITAEQNKLKAERDLQRIEVEAQQKIASAKAEAEALRLQRMEITPDLLKLRQTENEKRAIEKWDGRLPQTVLGNAVPFVNLQSGSK
ncbi:MAG TPA: prohibitin family protein [Macromonas sp.]|nr:prohibitin family protein [Macromonas sp.]